MDKGLKMTMDPGSGSSEGEMCWITGEDDHGSYRILKAKWGGLRGSRVKMTMDPGSGSSEGEMCRITGEDNHGSYRILKAKWGGLRGSRVKMTMDPGPDPRGEMCPD